MKADGPPPQAVRKKDRSGKQLFYFKKRNAPFIVLMYNIPFLSMIFSSKMLPSVSFSTIVGNPLFHVVLVKFAK